MSIQESRPVIQMDLEGNEIKEFDSVKSAVKQFGGAKKAYTNVWYACLLENRKDKIRKKTNVVFGYKWKFKN